MKYLLDQNLSPQTTVFLKKLGVDAVDLRTAGLFGKTDDVIYAYAVKHNYVLITYDLEFGPLYLSDGGLKGLILLRLHPQTLEFVHDTLKKLFSTVTEKQIKKNIVVLERHRVRLRRVQL